MIKFLLFILSILISFNMFGEQVKLTLDLEIKEPEDVFFNKIVDIAIDSQNSIYILDRKEKFLYQFSEEGQFVKKIGHPGKNPGEFEFPWSVILLYSHKDQ